MAIYFEVGRLAKDKLGCSMVELADQLGLDHQTLYYWNQGRSTPRVPTLLSICTVVGCTWADLGDYLVIRPGKQANCDCGVPA